MTTRIGLIGAFSVSGDDAPPAIRGDIPQAIVARLALAEGAVLDADTLIADIWRSPPPGVLSSLRAHVSRLRARGWGGVLSGGREGYRLAMDGIETDATVFEAAIAPSSGDREAHLRIALRLWRRNPTVWAREFPFADALDARLHRAHRAISRELAGILMARADADQAARLLEPLLDRDPSDADSAAALASALHEAGRLAEAAALRARVPASAEPSPPAEPEPPDGQSDDPTERHGIPVPSTAFIGRDVELAAIAAGRRSARLLTLIGPAGVGKTRLAVEAARRTPEGEDDVQWMVDLTVVESAGDVLPAVAEAVAATEPTISAIARAVSERRGLLILDNAEHVLGAVATACAELLGTCAGLGILVTSRESLRMTGERVISVPPLLGAELADAVELFRRRTGSGEDLNAQRRREIEHLCTMLDGLPLAIELAAARMDGMGLGSLTRSLTAEAPRRAAAVRHETIDAAIDWSVRLVPATEREMLSQLAGFAGAFSPETVAAVCVVPDDDPVRLVVVLARRSLVQPVPGERGRFRLLRAVQPYVHRELPLVDEEAWTARHAQWFLDAARREAARLDSPSARTAKATVRAMRADLEQAVEGALARGERALALGFAGALGRFWADRGAASSALRMIDESLALPGPPLPDDEAAALRGAVMIATVAGDARRVVGYAERYAAVAPDAADPTHAMLSDAMSAYLAASMQDVERADALLARAERHRPAVASRDPWTVPEYLVIRGDALRSAGRPAQALEVLGEAYRLASDLDHTWARATASFISGRTLIDVGRPDEALPILRGGVIRFLEHEDAPMALSCAEVFAVALTELKRSSEAAEIFATVDALGERFGFGGDGVDPLFARAARARVRAALPRIHHDRLVESGRTRSLPWLASALVP